MYIVDSNKTKGMLMHKHVYNESISVFWSTEETVHFIHTLYYMAGSHLAHAYRYQLSGARELLIVTSLYTITIMIMMVMV